jgi:hypothetical protein
MFQLLLLKVLKNNLPILQSERIFIINNNNQLAQLLQLRQIINHLINRINNILLHLFNQNKVELHKTN